MLDCELRSSVFFDNPTKEWMSKKLCIYWLADYGECSFDGDWCPGIYECIGMEAKRKLKREKLTESMLKRMYRDYSNEMSFSAIAEKYKTTEEYVIYICNYFDKKGGIEIGK